MHALSDEELMELVKGDNPQAPFEELMHRHEKKLINYLNRTLGDFELAENLAQETFLRIYGKRMDYEPTAKFQTFLYKVATNLAIDEFRKRARRKEELRDDFSYTPDAGKNPEDCLVSTSKSEAVRRSLMKLDEKHRSVIIMKWYEGLKYEEIAKILDISVGTVKSRIFYALKQLEAELRPLLHEE